MNPQPQNQTTTTNDAVADLMKRLDTLWNKADVECYEFYEDYDRGYAELENEPLECDVARAKMRIVEGDKIAIDYSAVHVYDMCTNFCGPYDEEDVNVDEAYAQCREACLEDAESYARRVINEYRRVIDKWAKKRGIAYTEELKRDELNFTLTIKLHPAGL